VPIAGIFAALLAAAAANTAATPVDRPVVRVVVRTERALVVDRRTLTGIVTTTRDIWRPYADVTFEFASAEQVPAGALQLLITDRVSPVSDGASLGWIEFIDGRPSNVITVSTTAVATLMKASRWNGTPKMVQRTFLERALARAIAHELGHFLLASREHAARGLMRGQLTAEEIMQPHRASFRLDRAQVDKLRSSTLLARRNEPAEDSGSGRP
jgi:hypothetical protein